MSSYLDIPLKQVVIKATPTRAKARSTGDTVVGVHFSDLHFPYHHPAALGLLYQIITLMKPQMIVDHGDTIDAYSISKYEKDPNHRTSLADELLLAGKHFAQIQAIAPQADLHWIPGNHEDRLRRLIWNATTSRELREVLTIPEVQRTVSIENLLGIADRWQIHNEEPARFYNGKMLGIHGNIARKAAGASAKAELETHGKSGLSGHCHRQGNYRNRDYEGSKVWHELGCMCSLTPHSGSNLPDWHLGFAIVTYHPDQDLFHVEPVVIEETLNGGAVGLFRGTTLHALPSDTSHISLDSSR